MIMQDLMKLIRRRLGSRDDRVTAADLEYACSNDVQAACLQAGALRFANIVLKMAKEIIEHRRAETLPSETAGGPTPDNYQREEFLATFREAHNALHRLWSDAVGKESYDKASWRSIDNALGRFARDAAEQVGIGRSEPILGVEGISQ